MLLVNAPVALTGPSVVLVVNAVVGLAAVSHTTPCCVGSGMPSAVTVPCPVAVALVIAVTAWVVTVGADVPG